tara:strand:+ start:20 stop:394 length:375 start_codon:yes stop_codon:yes gene_type:complete
MTTPIPIKIFGLSNCTNCQKTLKILNEKKINFEFSDVRKNSIDYETLLTWCQSVGWERLLNKRSTTWRNLNKNEKDNLNQEYILKLILRHPTLIKRPVIILRRKILIGYNDLKNYINNDEVLND